MDVAEDRFRQPQPDVRLTGHRGRAEPVDA
jgi:hypothetical protein